MRNRLHWVWAVSSVFFVLVSVNPVGAKLDVAQVRQLLSEAHQGAWTTHAMVFEPSRLKLHLALGDGSRSATDFPWQEIDLAELLRP